MMIIHVVGKPASGKTFLRKALSKELGWPSYAIDDERIALLKPGSHWPDDDAQAWENLGRRMVGDCIVETSGVYPKRDVFRSAAVLTILCRVDSLTRESRLRGRLLSGYPLAPGKNAEALVGRYVQRMLGSDEPEYYDAVWSGGPLPLVAVQKWLAHG